MNEEEENKPKKNGGLYKNINISVKALNCIIIGGIIILAILFAVLLLK